MSLAQNGKKKIPLRPLRVHLPMGWGGEVDPIPPLCAEGTGSDCIPGQGKFSIHGLLSLIIAFMFVSSFLATAMIATIFGLPSLMRFW